MQTRDLLFTPPEAAVLTRLSAKAVNNAIDKKTISTVPGRREGRATRLLVLRTLISLVLEHRLADRPVPEMRRKVSDALAMYPLRGRPRRHPWHDRSPVSSTRRKLATIGAG
jgi:hypothetical protein